MKMICHNCGNEIENANFCPVCGARIPHPKPKAPQGSQGQRPTQGHRPSQGQHGGISKKKLFLFLVPAIILLIGLLILFAVIMSKYGKSDEKTSETASQQATEKKTEENPTEHFNPTTEKITEASTEVVANSIPDMLREIVTATKQKEGYSKDNNRHAKGFVTDLNGDGIYELFMVYAVDHQSNTTVNYEIWTLNKDGASPVLEGLVYDPTAGETGTLSIKTKDDSTYLVLSSRSEIAGQFSETVTYYPWPKDTAMPDFQSSTVLSASGTIGKESTGDYRVNAKTVNYSEYRTEGGQYLTKQAVDYSKQTVSDDIVYLDDLATTYKDLKFE